MCIKFLTRQQIDRRMQRRRTQRQDKGLEKIRLDRFYANEMQFSLTSCRCGNTESTANEWIKSSANEKLLIKMTTQLKLNAGNNSMQWRWLEFDSDESFTGCERKKNKRCLKYSFVFKFFLPSSLAVCFIKDMYIDLMLLTVADDNLFAIYLLSAREKNKRKNPIKKSDRSIFDGERETHGERKSKSKVNQSFC